MIQLNAIISIRQNRFAGRFYGVLFFRSPNIPNNVTKNIIFIKGSVLQVAQLTPVCRIPIFSNIQMKSAFKRFSLIINSRFKSD